MPKNQYFNQGFHIPEKDLLMDLSQEVISIHGINVEWILNPHTNVDSLYREDRMPNLGPSQTIVVYVSSGAEGVIGNAIFSKFGFLNQQQINLQVSVKEWTEVFGSHRPNEGDIFYIPGRDPYGPKDFFKVTYIDRENATGWFPLGKHHTFEVTAEKWAYSSEKFDNTNVAEIDDQIGEWSNDVTLNPNLEREVAKTNDAVQTISDPFVDWNEKNPFGES